MASWDTQHVDILHGASRRPEIARSFHASIHALSALDTLVFLQQPADRLLPAPFCTRTSCRICLPCDNPAQLKSEISSRLNATRRFWLAYKNGHETLPVRLCDGPLQMTAIAMRRLACFFSLQPPISEDEWVQFGNFWRFQVLVNYDTAVVYADSDADLLCGRLRSMDSFFLSAERYEDDVFMVVKDNHGASISYMNSDGNGKMFSINPAVPKGKVVVQQYVEEIDEGTEVDAHFIIPSDEAIQILHCYLTSGRVVKLQSQTA
jgi:hypothetical protein